jgi:hypothetical protein
MGREGKYRTGSGRPRRDAAAGFKQARSIDEL